MTTRLPRSMTDGAHEFYSQPLEQFIAKVKELTANDRRLELLFYATRQRYLDNLEELDGSNVIMLSKRHQR